MKRVRKAKIGRKTIYIRWEKLKDEILVGKNGKKIRFKILGLADPPTENPIEITINPNQGKKELLATIIHEFVHVHFPKTREKNVEKFARSLAETLWKMGLKFK